MNETLKFSDVFRKQRINSRCV